MITVEESLSLSELSSVTVRSGQGGLSRRVSWTHVMGGNKIAHFLEGGELLLTSGKGWPNNPVLEEDLLQSLLNHQVSGIIFATGHYLMDCPPAAIDFGDNHSIPILEMPFDVPFVKVTKAINQLIMNKQFRKNELMNSISPDLTEDLKSSGNYKETCRILASYFNSPVILTTSDQKILTQAIPDDNHSKFNPLLLIKNWSDKLDHSISQDNSSKQATQIIYFTNPEFQSGVAVLLYIGTDVWGILWLPNFEKDGEQAKEFKILEYTSSVLTDLYLKQKEIAAKLKLTQFEVLELLFEKSEIASSIVEGKLNNLGLKRSKQWITGIVITDLNRQSSDAQKLSSIREKCQSWLNDSEGIDGFCQIYQQQLVLIISSDLDILQLKDNLKKMHMYLKQTTSLTLLFGGIKTECHSLNQSYDDAKSLSSIVRTLYSEGGAYFSDELRREILLYQGITPEQANELRRAILPNEFFSQRGEILYDTLKSLVINDFNREKTAEALHIHRNTLRYRIEKIEELLQCRLTSSRCQFWVQVALDLGALTS
ncbi:PucR family transcriptional regulator [Psychrobacillus sp. NPDC093180]|uniref:PucR family transcriptional regulator n=1 Tax=Psychrobacillus sp. NPDC093180 TaxID=3364489 RepID=UPI0037F3AA0D